jgi:hypothetical protein
LDFENWARNNVFIYHRKGNKIYSFDGLLDFERFLKGYHINHPNMSNWRPGRESRAAMEWMFNRDNRYVDVQGVRRQEVEDNASVQTLTG